MWTLQSQMTSLASSDQWQAHDLAQSSGDPTVHASSVHFKPHFFELCNHMLSSVGAWLGVSIIHFNPVKMCAASKECIAISTTGRENWASNSCAWGSARREAMQMFSDKLTKQIDKHNSMSDDIKLQTVRHTPFDLQRERSRFSL